MSESSCLCYLTITYNKMCRALAYTLSIHTLVRLTHSHSLAFYRHLPSALLVSSAYWLYDSLPVRPVYCAGFSIRGLQNRDTAFWGQFFRHRVTQRSLTKAHNNSNVSTLVTCSKLRERQILSTAVLSFQTHSHCPDLEQSYCISFSTSVQLVHYRSHLIHKYV